MKRCVAIDQDGNPVSVYNSLKEAAIKNGLLPPRIWQAITHGKVLLGMKWMYEDVYNDVTEKGRGRSLAWGKKAAPIRKRRKHSQETKDKIALTKKKNAEYCKGVFARAFISFTSEHMKWLNELKEKFLEIGDFGIRPELLADYYTDKKDKEVALLISLLITMKDKCYDRVIQYYNVIGEHPWDWFKSRGFSSVNGLPYVEKARLFRLLNAWWEECFKYGSSDSIEECLFSCCEKYGISPLEMMQRTCGSTGRRLSPLRLAVVLLVCSRSDGLGQGLWATTRESIKIPVTGHLLTFLKEWMPDCTRYGSPDECAALFDMDSVDFYYCYLAYEMLKKLRPKECSAYASFYYEAYMRHTVYKPSGWKIKLPKIIFSPENENL